MLSFMNAFKGYNQNFMVEEDVEKTAFVTLEGIFYYIVTTIMLKNAKATYQRIVNWLFGELLRTTMEAYIEYMVVKSKGRETPLANLAKCFEIMRTFNLRLNPKNALS